MRQDRPPISKPPQTGKLRKWSNSQPPINAWAMAARSGTLVSAAYLLYFVSPPIHTAPGSALRKVKWVKRLDLAAG